MPLVLHNFTMGENEVIEIEELTDEIALHFLPRELGAKTLYCVHRAQGMSVLDAMLEVGATWLRPDKPWRLFVELTPYHETEYGFETLGDIQDIVAERYTGLPYRILQVIQEGNQD